MGLHPETGLLEGGARPEPSRWPIAILRVLRKGNQAIVTVNLAAYVLWAEPAHFALSLP